MAEPSNISADFADTMPQPLGKRLGPALLIYFHSLACCISLLYVGQLYGYFGIGYDDTRFYDAALNVIPFLLVSILFTFARFSFGYILGFYFYTMILGFLWLVVSSKFNYNRELASVSAIASAIAFLVPTLFITSPIQKEDIVSVRTFDRLLTLILILAVAVIAVSALDNFMLVDYLDRSIDALRNQMSTPVALRYLIPITSNALLPFAFACFVMRGNLCRATLVIVFLLLFYPITLTKSALFGPLWLLVMALISKMFEARTTVVLSLFVPVLTGIVLIFLFKQDVVSYGQIYRYFGLVNFRMVAVPSSALDMYNEFFSTHDLTYFCQINLLKSFVDCPYSDSLSIVMEKTYKVGNFNASLFATEGVASVGLSLAPIVVLACGLFLSLVNRISAGLSPRFILMSSAIFPQIFLNVSLTTSLVTDGAAVLFLMWYITPRKIFELK